MQKRAVYFSLRKIHAQPGLMNMGSKSKKFYAPEFFLKSWAKDGRCRTWPQSHLMSYGKNGSVNNRFLPAYRDK
jgi:hypothetical protein